MNLHGIVRAAVTTVNPDVLCTYQQSTGYVTDAAGNRKPSFVTIPNVAIQVQPVTTGMLQHLDYLNIQGQFRAVYLYGSAQGVVRPTKQGGDLLWFGLSTQCWKVVEVVETWPDWSKVIVCLQTDGMSSDAVSNTFASGYFYALQGAALSLSIATGALTP